MICLFIITAYVFIASYLFFGGGTFYGYRGYCDKVKLIWTESIIALELFLTVAFVLFFIIQEFFNLFKSKKVFSIVCLLIMLNLVFMTCNIIEYPILIRSYGFLAATGEGNMYNPQIFIGIFQAVLFLLWNFRYLKKRNDMLSLLKISVFIVIIILVILIRAVTAQYIECHG